MNIFYSAKNLSYSFGRLGLDSAPVYCLDKQSGLSEPKHTDLHAATIVLTRDAAYHVL